MYMEAANYPDVLSRNVIGELPGTEYPDQKVLLSGHIDSWDVDLEQWMTVVGCLYLCRLSQSCGSLGYKLSVAYV